MHVIAIHRLDGDRDSLAARLAEVLDLTVYEARPRVALPDGGPAVVARFADPERAAACTTKLEQAGFRVLTVDTERLSDFGPETEVRRLSFAEDRFEVELASGPGRSVAAKQIALLLSGTGIVQELRTEVSSERKFSLGRAIATGGLVMGKTHRTVNQEMAEERDRFCVLAGPGLDRLILFQSRLDFQALGDRRQPTREANFSWVLAELKRLCPMAHRDDRLRTRAGQVQLLGAALPPEQHLHLAVDLLVKSSLASGREN